MYVLHVVGEYWILFGIRSPIREDLENISDFLRKENKSCKDFERKVGYRSGRNVSGRNNITLHLVGHVPVPTSTIHQTPHGDRWRGDADYHMCARREYGTRIPRYLRRDEGWTTILRCAHGVQHAKSSVRVQ